MFPEEINECKKGYLGFPRINEFRKFYFNVNVLRKKVFYSLKLTVISWVVIFSEIMRLSFVTLPEKLD